MEPIEAIREGDEIYSRLKWALFYRVVALTLLLGATAYMQWRAAESLLVLSLVSIYVLVGATYLFTLISAILLGWLGRSKAFVYVQIIYEALLITALISITGRIFSFVYILSILSASILLRRQGAFIAAAISTAAYSGLLAYVNLYQWREKLYFINRDFFMEVWGMGIPELVYTIAINASAFFMVAWLSSHLAEQLEQTGQQLREREEDLEELEARSGNIIRSLKSGIVALDREGRITSFNPAAEEITGRSEADMLGKPIVDLFPGLEIENNPIDWVYFHPSRNLCHLSLTSTILRGSRGQEMGTLILFQDQTAFREMQEQLKISDRLAAVGQLAAGLAHEIRNPLASISGSIQLLHQDQYDADEKRLMKIVLRETDRLNKLITEFLHFARPSVGPSKRIHLVEILAETIEIFRQGAEKEMIKTSLSCPEGLFVEIDPSLLRQILWNLYVNAAEAMDGKGEIAVGVETDGEDSMIRISVADTGPGIPPEIQEKIFTPFFTTKEFGTGLGLATVYRSVESLGGQVTVRSGPGKGAVVTIELPGFFRAEESKNDTMNF